MKQQTKCVTILTALAGMCLTAGADAVRFEGVLGNSGELDNPVTFGPMRRDMRSLGVTFDAVRGVLYERAGNRRLNAYTLDGRQIAHYAIPETFDHRDMMTLCGDTLVLLLGAQLYTLPLNAPEGTTAQKLSVEIDAPDTLSSSAHDGRVAVRSKSGRLVLLSPADGAVTPFGEAIAQGPCLGMDWDADGSFFIVFGKTAYKLENGRLLTDALWPKLFAGNREANMERVTRHGAYWYGSAWHGTIKRFSADFEPAPGVVLGGASGHFIGHVPCNYDAELARGIRQLAPGLFAIGGLYCVVQIAEWNPEKNGLTLVRRIGALTAPGGLSVDAQGRVLAGRNIWTWDADSLAPADVSHVYPMVTPCAWLNADIAVGLAEVYGKPSIAMGRFGEETLFCNRLDAFEMPEKQVGIAVYREQPGAKGGWRLLVLGADGKAKVHEIAEDHRNPWRKYVGEAVLKTAMSAKAFSAVTMKDAETLLVAADGQVIEFARDGADWKERDRWSDGFGNALRLSVDGGRVAVADAEKNRMTLYALADRRKLVSVEVAAPTEVALNGSFFAVYDSTGQRIMKYRIAGND